jgi:hypothetical protein
MKGNDQVRFCEHCELSVRDLSQMTRAKAERLVRQSKGRLCLRIHRDPLGQIITRESIAPLYNISRRASRIAAGAFTAVMSMSTAAYAQRPELTAPGCRVPVAEQTQPLAQGNFAWLAVTVADYNGAAVLGAQVTVTNEQTGEIQSLVTDDAGLAKAWLGGGSTYSVEVQADGFIVNKTTKVSLRSSEETPLGIQLGVRALMGDVAISETHIGTENGAAAVDDTYKQPLVRAVNDDDMDEVNQLLRSGVSVDQPEADGTTALEVAVADESYPMILRLLRAGANANAVKANGQNVLFEFDDNSEIELILLMLKYGAEVNRIDNEGNTPLLKFAEWDSAEHVQVLLDAGANVNAQNNEGLSALMIAAQYANTETLSALLAAGADRNLRDHEGKTALQQAEENEDDEIADLLRGATGRIHTTRTPQTNDRPVVGRVKMIPEPPRVKKD